MAPQNPLLQSMLNRQLGNLANPDQQPPMSNDPEEAEALQLESMYPQTRTPGPVRPGQQQGFIDPKTGQERPPWAGTPFAPPPGQSMPQEDVQRFNQLYSTAEQIGQPIQSAPQEKAPDLARKAAEGLMADEMEVQKAKLAAEQKLEKGTVNTDPMDLSQYYRSSAQALSKITDTPRASAAMKELSKLVSQKAELSEQYLAKINPAEFGRPDYSADLNKKGLEDFIKENRTLREKQKVELDNITDQIKEKKLDPANFWANKGAFNQLLAGISIALGGYGRALSGGSSNIAMQIIDKAADRDWEAQKSELDKLYKLHGLTSESIKQLNDQEAHDLSVLNSSELLGLEHRQAKFAALEGQLKLVTEQIKNEEQKAGYDNLIADIQNKRADIANKINTMEDRQVGRMLELGKELAKQQAAGKGKAPTTGMAQHVSDARSTLSALEDLRKIPKEKLNQLLQFSIAEKIDLFGDVRSYFDSAEKAGLRAELQTLANVYRHAITGSQAGWKEIEFLKNSLPNLGDRNSEVFLSKLDAAHKRFRTDHNLYLDTLAKTGYNVSQLSPAEAPLDTNDPRVQKALEAGYSEQEIREFMRGK
jgi:hypothetical protein